MQQSLDFIAELLPVEGLKRNTKPVRWYSFFSLGLLFAPGLLFVIAIWLLKDRHPQYAWANNLALFPWQFWGIALFGTIATLGGAGDWLFHKVYTTVGPNEHHSHILALAAGGIVFILMALASVARQPLHWLLPIIVALLVTVTLICYDEFAFHTKRCKPFETLLHRMLVLGNGAAFLIWLHWIFVEGAVRAGA